jgi:hypothetical protein
MRALVGGVGSVRKARLCPTPRYLQELNVFIQHSRNSYAYNIQPANPFRSFVSEVASLGISQRNGHIGI